MHRDTARQAHRARVKLASQVHTHWKRKAPLMKRHIPGVHDREPDNGQATGRGGASDPISGVCTPMWRNLTYWA